MTPWTEVGWGPVLVDGFGAARWKVEREKELAVLRIEPFRKLPREKKAWVLEEGARLLAFLVPGDDRHDVRIVTC